MTRNNRLKNKTKWEDHVIIVNEGNLLDSVHEGLIVHGCNAQGVMGSGFARSIRAAYPECFEVYDYQRMKFSLKLGTVSFAKIDEQLAIGNLITQEFFGRDGKKYVDYQAVKAAFMQAGVYAKANRLEIHYPLIGCGLGGGDWEEVSVAIKKGLSFAGVDKSNLWIMKT